MMARSPVRILAAAAVLALSGFPACTRTDPGSALPAEAVTIACATPPFTALVDVALARGYFRQEGLAVTPRFHSTGKNALEEVLAGVADVATVAETPVMFAVMNGEEVAIIATIQTSTRMGVVFGRSDKGVKEPQDLKGRRIGATFGSIGEYFLDAFLAAHGISRKDITAVNLTPEEMPGALATGEVDAVSTWPSVVSQAQEKLGHVGVTFNGEGLYTESFNIATTQEYIRTRPARVEKLLRALIKADDFVRRAPGKAQQVVADFRQMDRALLIEQWAGSTFGVSLDQLLLLALEDESRWAMQGGLTAGREMPNYLGYVYLDALLAIRPGAVRILR